MDVDLSTALFTQQRTAEIELMTTVFCSMCLIPHLLNIYDLWENIYINYPTGILLFYITLINL